MVGFVGKDTVVDVAQQGVSGPGEDLPHGQRIQLSFGHHDVSGVRAHVGGEAAEAAAAIGAKAYATGDDVAFAAAPDLRQAAHEAAHVVQQRGGVRLDGGVGTAGDPYEQHADAVADLVVAGRSAEALLDTMAHRGSAGGPAVQRWEGEDAVVAEAGPRVEGDATAPTIIIGHEWLRHHGVGRGSTGSITPESHPAVIAAIAEAMLPLYPGSSQAQIARRIYLRLQAVQWRRPSLEFMPDAGMARALLTAADPGEPIRVVPGPNGITVWLDLRSAYAGSGDRVVLRVELARQVLDRLEAEVGHEMLIHPRDEERRRLEAGIPTTSEEVNHLDYDRRRLRDLFGDAISGDYLSRDREEPEEPATVETAEGPRTVPPGTTAEERAGAREMLRLILGPPRIGASAGDRSPAPLTRAEIVALHQLSLEEEAQRDRIIEELREMRGSSAETPRDEAFDGLIASARADVERRDAARELGVDVPDGSDPDDGPQPMERSTRTPLVARPVRGAIESLHQINARMAGAFRFAQVDRRDEIMAVPHVEVQWYAYEVAGDERRQVASGRQRYIDTLGRETEPWAPTLELAGTYEIHAFVDHTFFTPAHFSLTILVRDSAQILADMHRERSRDFGEARGRPVAHDFDVEGTFRDRRGSIQVGEMYPGAASEDVWLTGSMEQQRLQDEIRRLVEVEEHYREVGDTRTADAVLERLDHLRGYERRTATLLRAEGGLHPVETQAFFATRTAGVQSCELDVIVAFETTPGSDGGLVWSGRLWDHTDIVGVLELRASGASYQDMMEGLFNELTTSYPPGDISLAFQLWDEQVQPTERFERFNRSTETSLGRARALVFAPEAQIAVNVASMLFTLFPPTTGIAVSIGIAYNAAATIDDEAERWRTGQFTYDRATADTFMLLCDILPLLSGPARTLVIGERAAAAAARSLPARAIGRTVSFLERGADIYVVYLDYQEQLRQLHDGMVAELAQIFAEIQERRSHNPNDPALPELVRRMERQRSQISMAAYRLFAEMGQQQIAMRVMGHAVGMHTESRGHADAESHGRGHADAEPHGRGHAETETHGRGHAEADTHGHGHAEADTHGRTRADGEELPPGLRLPDLDEVVDGPFHGGVRAETVVTPDMHTELQSALGLASTAPVLRDHTLSPREVAIEVTSTDTGDFVSHVRYGPDATVADILEHRQRVQVIERYNGTLGQFRRLWDRMEAFVRGRPFEQNPFPPNTVAWDSWHEVHKLRDEVLPSRRARLGRLLDAERAALMRLDIRFNETELARHERVVDDAMDSGLGTEAGSGTGSIRARADTTIDAYTAGYPRPEEMFPNDPNIRDDYYCYENSHTTGDIRYRLRRREDAPASAPILHVARRGGVLELTRGDSPLDFFRATAVTAYEAFVRTVTGGRAVPLRGVAPTDITLGSVPNFETSLRRIIEVSLRRQARSEGQRMTPELRERLRAEASGLAAEVAAHPITVVIGTPQLRGYDYRGAHTREHGAPTGDLHHLIPLYLGGDHTRLIDLHPDLHDHLHELIDGLRLSEGSDLTLSPSSMQSRSDLTFSEGAAILYDDGTLQLFRFDAESGSMVPVGAERRPRDREGASE